MATTSWWLPLLERDRLLPLFVGLGDCDFSLDEFSGAPDSTDLLLLLELLLCVELGVVDLLRDRDFLGEERAADSTDALRDLERLERSTELECDGDRSNNIKNQTSKITKFCITTTLLRSMMRQSTNLFYFAF